MIFRHSAQERKTELPSITIKNLQNYFLSNFLMSLLGRDVTGTVVPTNQYRSKFQYPVTIWLNNTRSRIFHHHSGSRESGVLYPLMIEQEGVFLNQCCGSGSVLSLKADPDPVLTLIRALHVYADPDRFRIWLFTFNKSRSGFSILNISKCRFSFLL